MIEPGYKVAKKEPGRSKFSGPGLSPWTSEISYDFNEIQARDREGTEKYYDDRILVMLARAYAAGRDSMRNDLRLMLNTTDTPPLL